MRLKNNILLWTLLLSGLAGCNPVAKIFVLEAQAPALNGLTSVHGKATVLNEGTRDFTVESATFAVRYRDRELGSARLLLPVRFPAGEVSEIRYDFALEDFSLSSLRTLQSRVMTNPELFTVDVRGWVVWGGIRKKIVLREVPLMRVMGIINNFAP